MPIPCSLYMQLLLDAFRSAIVDGGRVAAEMRGLQQQLLGSAAMQPPLPIPLRYSLSQLQQSAGGALHQQAKQSLPAAAGGTEGLGSAAARAAVALGSKTPFLGEALVHTAQPARSISAARLVSCDCLPSAAASSMLLLTHASCLHVPARSPFPCCFMNYAS